MAQIPKLSHIFHYLSTNMTNSIFTKSYFIWKHPHTDSFWGTNFYVFPVSIGLTKSQKFVQANGRWQHAYYFFNYNYTLELSFERVFAGWEVQLTRLFVLLPRRDDATLIYLAIYSVQAIVIQWPRAMWRKQPSPDFMATDILTQHAPPIEIPCSANLFCRRCDSIQGLYACEWDALTTCLTMPTTSSAYTGWFIGRS